MWIFAVPRYPSRNTTQWLPWKNIPSNASIAVLAMVASDPSGPCNRPIQFNAIGGHVVLLGLRSKGLSSLPDAIGNLTSPDAGRMKINFTEVIQSCNSLSRELQAIKESLVKE